MKARDVMVRLTEYLGPDNTVREAVKMLRGARRDAERVGVKGLPVLNGEKKLIGILTMSDILKAAWPSYMSLMNLGDFTWDGMLEEMEKKVADKKVETIMTRDVMTVNEDSPLMECVDHMIKGRVKRLPVVDGSGRVTGMLYERDVFFAVTKALLEEGSDR